MSVQDCCGSVWNIKLLTSILHQLGLWPQIHTIKASCIFFSIVKVFQQHMPFRPSHTWSSVPLLLYIYYYCRCPPIRFSSVTSVRLSPTHSLAVVWLLWVESTAHALLTIARGCWSYWGPNTSLATSCCMAAHCAGCEHRCYTSECWHRSVLAHTTTPSNPAAWKLTPFRDCAGVLQMERRIKRSNNARICRTWMMISSSMMTPTNLAPWSSVTAQAVSNQACL